MKNIIAVASNKGGVGKSTVAVNLSVALARLGASAGILDADITGPNIPTMLGIDQGLMAEGGVGLQTIEAHGIKAVSLGFVLPKGTPVVWRGPMIGSGVRQLLHDVDWGERVRAIVVLKNGQVAEEDEIIEFCRQRLASYKKPESVVFTDELPRNPMGKVLKRVLREQYDYPVVVSG